MYFWRRVSLFLGNSRAVAHPPTEKSVEGTDTYLNQGRKVRTVAPANQQLCRYALQVWMHCGLVLGGQRA